MEQSYSKEQMRRMEQFLEFFQELRKDFISTSNAIPLENIKEYVIQLLAINPIQTAFEKRYAEYQRSASKQSLEILTKLIPYPQIPKGYVKKIHDTSTLFRNRFEETKAYFMNNSPFAGLRPVSHKINWESPAGAAILTILVTKRRFPNGLFAILSKITGICENTLRSKRKELLNPKNTRPIHSFVEHTRKPKIPPDLRKMMVAEIIEQLPSMPRLTAIQNFCVSFLQRPENLKKFLHYQKPDLTEPQLKAQLDFYLDKTAKSKKALNDLFHASYNWIIQVLDEEGIGLYSPLTPTNKIDQTYANIFIEKVSDALKTAGRSLVLNLDETSVKISMNPQKSLNLKDPKQRVRTHVKSSKACFTAVGIIGADGTRYDPLVIAKGTTPACGRVIDQLIDEGFRIHRKLFSETGWMNAITMSEVLDYVAEIRDSKQPGAKVFLVLDVYRPHIAKTIKEKAKQLNIKLITVPANGTGIYQPLDVLIFGILKQYLRQSYRSWLEELHPSSDISVALKDGIARFVEAWERITKDQILSAWDKIPELMNKYKSKKRNLDEIYGDIDQINDVIDHDFIDMNFSALSEIVKKENDIYRDTALFHYDSMYNDGITIESGSANLTSSSFYNLFDHMNCNMTDDDLLKVQSFLDDIYNKIEEVYEEYMDRNYSEEEDIQVPKLFKQTNNSEKKEESLIIRRQSPRNLNYSFNGMDISDDVDDDDDDGSFKPKRKIQFSPTEVTFETTKLPKNHVDIRPKPHKPVEKFSIFDLPKSKEVLFSNIDNKIKQKRHTLADKSSNFDLNKSKENNLRPRRRSPPVQSNFKSLEFVSLSENHPDCFILNAPEYNGYFNVGNTCYINSCLIVLFHFFEFRNLLETASISLKPLRQPDPNNEGLLLDQILAMFDALSTSDPEIIILTATDFCNFLNHKSSFKRMFSEYQQENEKSNAKITSNSEKETETSIANSEKETEKSIANSEKETETSIANTQNDARNFFEYILNEIMNEINIPLDNLNFAKNLENLMYYHTCTVFERYSTVNPPYPIASLGLTSTTNNLIECIEDFFKNEIDQSEENIGYERLIEPQTLFIFGLNRFNVSLNTGRAVKIRYPIVIPEAITINQKAFHGTYHIFVELQLYAVIVHNGQSTESGHYYTYLKPEPNGQWLCFNDSHVKIVGNSFLQRDDVLKNAYLVFYKNALQT